MADILSKNEQAAIDNTRALAVAADKRKAIMCPLYLGDVLILLAVLDRVLTSTRGPMPDVPTTDELVEAAYEHIRDLCRGDRKWRMCIPAKPDDSDIVLSSALSAQATELSRLRSRGAELEGENARLREALEKITEGRGRFSRDRLTFAENTIEDMKAIAHDALAAHAPQEGTVHAGPGCAVGNTGEKP